MKHTAPEPAEVLLVNPMFHRVFGPSDMHVPLGLLYLKSALAAKGLRAEVCQLDYEPGATASGADWDTLKARVQDTSQPWWRRFRRILDTVQPRIVGVGMVTPQFHAGAAAAQVAREQLPDAALIAGGIHPTAMPRETLTQGGFDYVVTGEGETVLPRLARHIINDAGRVRDIPGVALMHNGEYLHTGPAPLVKNLDTLPLPALSVITPDGRRTPAFRYSASMITGRGCPFNCTYCARSALWPRGNIRLRSVQHVMREIKRLRRRFELSYIYFEDDTFNQNAARVAEFCDAMRRTAPELGWQCKVRADRVDASQVRRMARAGCDSVYIGVESGAPEILRKMKRPDTLEHALRAVALFKKQHIFTHCTFIAGHPDETRDTLAATEQAVATLAPHKASVFFMVPYPGSEIFEQLRESDGLITDDWFRYTLKNPDLIRRQHIRNRELEERVMAMYRAMPDADRARRAHRLRPAFILRKLRGARSLSRLRVLAHNLQRNLVEKERDAP